MGLCGKIRTNYSKGDNLLETDIISVSSDSVRPKISQQSSFLLNLIRRLPSGMGFVVHSHKAIHAHMGIDLGGRQTGMA